MKNLLNLTLLILFSHFISGQIILGKYWHVSEIIGGDMENTQEYLLYEIDKNDEYHTAYGNKIIFNEDGSFSSNYSAPCRQDCFPSAVGSFKMIDERHIQLFVNEFSQGGRCESKHLKINREWGVYYISKKSDKIIKLIKSNVDFSQDQLNEKYSLMIDQYIEKVGRESSNFLDFETEFTDNSQRVNAYVKEKTEVKNYTILYTAKYSDYLLINLVKNEDIQNDYFFIINRIGNDFKNKVGYYKFPENELQLF